MEVFLDLKLKKEVQNWTIGIAHHTNKQTIFLVVHATLNLNISAPSQNINKLIKQKNMHNEFIYPKHLKYPIRISKMPIASLFGRLIWSSIDSSNADAWSTPVKESPPLKSMVTADY